MPQSLTLTPVTPGGSAVHKAKYGDGTYGGNGTYGGITTTGSGLTPLSAGSTSSSAKTPGTLTLTPNS